MKAYPCCEHCRRAPGGCTDPFVHGVQDACEVAGCPTGATLVDVEVGR